MKILLIFLVMCSVVSADDFVCYDSNTNRVTHVLFSFGDDKSLIVNDCIKVDRETASSINPSMSKIENGNIVELSQAEIDANTAAQAQAEADAKAATVVALDTKLDGVKLNDLTLTKVDAKIDAISNLAEAKAFLKLLVRGIIKLEAGQ